MSKKTKLFLITFSFGIGFSILFYNGLPKKVHPEVISKTSPKPSTNFVIRVDQRIPSIKNGVEKAISFINEKGGVPGITFSISDVNPSATIAYGKIPNIEGVFLDIGDGPNLFCEADENYFKVGLTEESIIEPFLVSTSALVETKERPYKIFLFTGESETLIGFKEQIKTLATNLGFQIVGDLVYDTRYSDYHNTVNKILSTDPDLLLVTNIPTTAAVFLHQAQELSMGTAFNFGGIIPFADSSDYDPIFENGLTVSDLPNKLFKKGDLNLITKGDLIEARSFLSTVILATAIRRSSNGNNSKISDVLTEGVFKSPLGEINFSKSNHFLERKIYLVKYHNASFEEVSEIGVTSDPTTCKKHL